ncbi:MAG: TetR/AcrR family transcriptional regulator [Anaerolineae bacterium]|nr:TetR/AcrR family transcriptional regulator [Anaerolineae bacterium]
MARTVKSPAERRNELIDAAQQLFYTKGYESTSVSDIVKAVGVAHGTFYYYFDSKLAVVEAIVEQAVIQSQAVLHAIVADETLSAIVKWQKAMQATGNWKVARKAELLEVGRMIMSDENVLLQYKLRSKVLEMTATELAGIIDQGVAEGVFTTQWVEESAEIITMVMASLSDTVGELLYHPDAYDNPTLIVERKHAAVQTAIERILGAPTGTLPIIDSQTINAWFTE